MKHFIYIVLLVVACSVQAAQVSKDYLKANRYNIKGQIAGEIFPDPDKHNDGLVYSATRYTYNSNGQLSNTQTGYLSAWQNETIAPKDWTGFTVQSQVIIGYDGYGRKIRETQAKSDGTALQITQYSYDTSDRLKCQAVRMNTSTFGSLSSNACSLVSSSEGMTDRITQYEYDSKNRIKTIKKAVGTTITQSYARYTYDQFWQQNTIKDANNNLAKREYDNHGRLYRWYFPSNTKGSGSHNTTNYEQYTYDKNGNIKQIRKRNGKKITYTYDRLNQVIEQKYSDGSMDDVYYSYSLLGQRLRAAWDKANKKNGIQYPYNVFGELQTETSNSYGDYKTVYSLEYGYDNNGNRTSIKYPDGKTFDYEYDNLNRLIDIDDPDDKTLFNPVYRNNGSLSSIKRPNNANTSFAVDSLLRIEQMKHNLSGNENDVTFNYAYNPAGQIKSLKLNNKKFEATQGPAEESYITNGLNQYSKVGSKSISYHTDGNLKDDGDNTYKYDVENRLITANTGRITVTFKYDPLGRLAEYKEGGTTRYFVYSGNALVAEYSDNHKMKARYVHAVGVDVPVVRYDKNTTSEADRRFLHVNHQGSIIAVSKSDGTVWQKNTYDEYGVPHWSNQTRFAYTGQIYLKALGLYYYKARIYHPKLGRFLQTDPIGYADNMNLYAYVGNDPMNFTDPMGMAKCGDLEGAKCEQALDDADAAKQDVDNVKAGIDSVTEAMANGDDLTAAQQGFVDAIGEKFGSKFTSKKGLSRLSKSLGKISNKIGARGQGMTLNQGSWDTGSSAAYVFGSFMGGFNTVYINDIYFDNRKEYRQYLMVHEAAHLNRATGDKYIRGGSNPYTNSYKAWNNADTYACTVYPRACGY